jgi:hypothetical protein
VLSVANTDHGVGASINMLVCRCHLGHDTDVREALDRMQLDLAGAMAHRNTSLTEMQTT